MADTWTLPETSPCGTDVDLQQINKAQEELNNFLKGDGVKEALDKINKKAEEIGAKLEAYKPKIEQNPNLQKALQKLQGATPQEALNVMAEIQEDFGPVVEDLEEILDEVSPDLKDIAKDLGDIFKSATAGGGSVPSGGLLSGLSGGNLTSLLGKANKLSSIDVKTICEKCKNLDIKQVETKVKNAAGEIETKIEKKAVELPKPPEIPKEVPKPEPVKPPQTVVRKQPKKAGEKEWLDAQNFARRALIMRHKKLGRPGGDGGRYPDVSEEEFVKIKNAFWAYYTYYYDLLAQSVKLSVPQNPDWKNSLEAWPWRETWLPMEATKDPAIVGDYFPIENEVWLYNTHKSVYNANNKTETSFEDATQLWYDKATEVMKLGVGVGKEQIITK
jgi:hypothetical protein